MRQVEIKSIFKEQKLIGMVARLDAFDSKVHRNDELSLNNFLFYKFLFTGLLHDWGDELSSGDKPLIFPLLKASINK